VQIHQLAYFAAVVQERHFTRAAELMSVAQPTLSKQVRVLESELGTPLFDRARGNITLTQAGELLYPLARRILSDVDTARRQVQELAGVRRGRVRLGATPSLMTGLLADALATFRRGFPDIELQVQESGSQDLVQHLVGGELDLGLVIVSRRTSDRGLVSTPIIREDLVVVSSLNEPPPSASGSIRVADLQNRPLVMFRPGYDLRDATLEACRTAGFEPALAVEGGEMDAVLRFAEAGLGLAVVPSMVLQSRPRLRRTSLTEPRLRRTVALAHRAGAAVPAAALAFRLTLMNHLETLRGDQLGQHLELIPVRTRLDLVGLAPVPVEPRATP